jgi:hypothetical protein
MLGFIVTMFWKDRSALMWFDRVRDQCQAGNSNNAFTAKNTNFSSFARFSGNGKPWNMMDDVVIEEADGKP